LREGSYVACARPLGVGAHQGNSMAQQIPAALNRVNGRVHAFMQFAGGCDANDVAFFTDHAESS